jgi:O-antigen ligase/Tfp pilus assembly protein PilF
MGGAEAFVTSVADPRWFQRLFRSPPGWLALASLVFVPFSADSFEAPQLFVLALGAWFVARTKAFTSRRHVLVVAVWLTCITLGALASQTVALSLEGLLPMFVAALLSLSVTSNDFRPVTWTVWPLAAWALAQQLGHDFVDWAHVASWCGGTKPFATLGHPTQLGVWMAMVTVLSLEDARVRRSLVSLLAALVAAMTCVMTLSRAGWLALGIGVVAWWLLVPGRRLVLAASLLGAGGLAALLVGRAALVERLTNALVAPTRVQLWGTAWKGFLEHPVLGWGFDTFLLVDQQLRHPEAWRYEWGGTAGHAHSFPAQVLATQGLFGGLVVLVLCVVAARGWSRQNAAPIAVVLAWAAASLVSFSGPLVLTLGWCALSLSLRERGEGRREGPRLPGWSRHTMLVPALAAALHFASSLVGHAAEIADEPRIADSRYRFATHLDPLSAEWPVRHGLSLERRGELREALATYELATQRVPNVAVYEANLGRVAAKLGDREQSHQWFERARRHAPLDARIALDAADASAQLGELELAEATLRSIVTLYPFDALAWFSLAKVRLRQGRPVEARAAFEASLANDWRDWPEGHAIARALTAAVQAGLGDPDLGAATRTAARPWVLPGEICGAPQRQ